MDTPTVTIRSHWACPYTLTLSYTANRIKSTSLPRYQPPLERQPVGAEHQGGIEIQLSVQRPHDVRRLAEAVLLAAEQQITDGDAVGAQCVHHDLGG